MITDAAIREQGYGYFLTEAPELVQTIEQELFSLSEGYSIATVHNLMRATHTIKGGAANVGLDVIQMIAHSLEDIFKALYNPDVIIDIELQTFLMQAYECLRLALNAELTGNPINDEELLQRATSIFVQLQEKLGDAFGAETSIPTSEELGFDIVQSIFETGVKQRLESIADAINHPPNTPEFVDFLVSQAEVFSGLAASLNLPGLGELALTILAALQSNPHQVQQIANIALADLQQARKAVLAGDRTSGGKPSSSLQKFIQTELQSNSSITNSTLNEEEFYQFLTTPGSNNEFIKPKTADSYLQVIHYIFGWFHHQRQVSYSDINLTLLIPQANAEAYIDNWLADFLDFIQDDSDSKSLNIYRHGLILIILLAVAKFQYSIEKSDSYISTIQALKIKILELAQEYKNYPPVKAQEKDWLENPKLQKLLEIQEIPAQTEDRLLESIWGGETNYNLNDEVITNQTEEFQLELLTSSQEVVTDIPETAVEVISDNEPIEEKSPSSAIKNPQQNSFIRVDIEGLERLNYLAGELLIYQKQRNLHDEHTQEILGQLLQRFDKHQATLNHLRDLPLQMQNLAFQQTQNFAARFDSLEMDVYTEFHLQLHEAIEQTLQLQETAESLDLLLKQATHFSTKKQSLTLNIIDNLVEARMLPLGNILNRFSYMVKKLSDVYAKPVELQLFGANVLVDKAIAEKLYDPLLHLVRNAFDHGIEPPQKRRELSKPEQGLIQIHAYHQGSQTIIEVRDDGRGLSLENIHKKAVELQHTSTDNQLKSYFSQPTESELLNLIFVPGFSTADKVSEISGRGIGLDIVRSQLQALNGSIAVHSSPNQGTTFILKIPFSMTTDKLMLVQTGGATYALLLDNIEKILIPSEQQIQDFEGKKVLYWNAGKDDQMVSIYQLSQLISYNGSFLSDAGSRNQSHAIDTDAVTNKPVLLLRRNQGILGLEVDQIIGEQELVIRPLGNAIAPPKYVYGCSSLANADLILVIDANLLLESDKIPATLDVMPLPKTSASAPLLTASTNEISAEQKLMGRLETNHKLPKVVLVVDDAISLRQTLSLTLQKSGYQVIQAQNGIEALEQLRSHPEIQVVISDLEMPRMNGFELLSHLRQNPDLTTTPVVVLTSRSAEKHRQLAKELGATAYLTKPYLEKEFLSTIESLVNIDAENLGNLIMISSY
ncbi:MAG: hybrid sensor histidine kinase/response regulator [Desmonostoc vinosum HA7617-LM4]|jgi:chemotaxis family two-component system sensor histidine kinase/response regulator PixL|nr:hybrid sensor histidine kinase/response regulator [Desmonostoc vinosum HA7617-LM4]